jgi:hypothetical protein
MNENTTAEKTTEEKPAEQEQPKEKASTPAASSEAAEKKPSEEKPAEKTFTQDEVNKMIADRLSREKRSADAKADEALKKIAALENRNSCYKAGVKDDYVDDVIALASRGIDDKTDFSKSLAKVLEKYPVFKAGNTPAGATTGVKTEDKSQADDAALRKAFGLDVKK